MDEENNTTPLLLHGSSSLASQTTAADEDQPLVASDRLKTPAGGAWQWNCFALDRAELLEYLRFWQSVIWLTMSGFGPIWALFSIFKNVSLTFASATMEPIVASDVYFYLETTLSFTVALGRTLAILKITFDREALQRHVTESFLKNGSGDTTAYVSHRAYWWSRRRFGLWSSCIFEFGDGMGRVWAPVSVADELCRLYIYSGGLFSNETYVTFWLVIALISAILRLLWWIWYWETFSARDPVKVAIERAQELTQQSINPAVEPPVVSKKAYRYPPWIATVYPNYMRELPQWLRLAAKRIYGFLDGFGRTWAMFAVFNTIFEHEQQRQSEDGRAFENQIYFWFAFVLALMGGTYVVFMRTFRRFKVFLH